MSGRKRWVYTEGGRPLPEPYEVSADWADDVRPSTGDLDKFAYDGLRQADGTVTDSASKLRAWQRRTGMEHVTEQQQEVARVRANQAREQREGTHAAAVDAFKKLHATGGRK